MPKRCKNGLPSLLGTRPSSWCVPVGWTLTSRGGETGDGRLNCSGEVMAMDARLAVRVRCPCDAADCKYPDGRSLAQKSFANLDAAHSG